MAGEKGFESRVRRYLESEGVYVAGTPKQDMTAPVCGWYVKIWGGGFQKSGVPDLLLCVNGFFLGVELKSDTGTASDLQKKNIVHINRGGGIGVILYPKGFEQFKNIIEGVKTCSSAIPGLNALKAANSSTKCAILTEYAQSPMTKRTTP